MEGKGSEDQQRAADMTLFVQDLVQKMQSRLDTMCDTIISTIDEMGSRIDGLEKDINEFRADMELDRSKPKRQDIKPEDAST
ncbi:heat shock factor-binding protein-like [Papaver somniferum]|uniref:heat shock factor-binding protein-like n=1 Tax=Papaver somniferum TaxID=3469 RepID=UPI000E6F5A24|nr:heat shock factor-binding protein-like [Papaver somniferum]